MKTLLTFLVCGLATTGSAQQSVKTFTSPDGRIRFRYPAILVNCMAPKTPASSIESDSSKGTQSAVPSIPDSCISQGGMCSGPGSGGSAIACFAYPKERFEDKPLFFAAMFFVSEIPSAKTEKVCLKGSPNWSVINSKVGTTSINGVSFKAFEIDDNWAGGGQSGPVYRTFHNERCYELGIQIAVSRGGYDPETDKAFTKYSDSQLR